MQLMKGSKHISIFIFVLILFGASVIHHSVYANRASDKSSVDSISREDMLKGNLAETLVDILKHLENIDDVIISIESSPVNVNIVTSSAGSLSLEAKEYIEKLIVGVFPESTIEYS